MILASLSSLLGSVWFATTLGLVGFCAGWYLKGRSCDKCKK
jgi:hypothetical protein